MPPDATTRRRGLVLAVGAAYGVSLLLVGLWPTHVDEDISVYDTIPGRWLLDAGLSYERTYRVLETSANVAMFVPFGVLAMVLSRRVTWLRAVLAALAGSGAIELLQAVARPGRTAVVSDVVANVSGAALGALLVLAWRQLAGNRAGT